MKHMFSLNIFFALKRFLSAGVRYFFCILIFTSYSFGQYNPDSVAIQEVAAGLRDNANAIWWGFNSTNVTSNLQAALNSRATKITIPNIGIPWIVDPLWLPSNKQITLESGVVLKARSGSFLGTEDCLLRAYDKQNITITGYGAQIEMNKDDYTVSPYLASEGRHCLSLGGCSNVNISGLKFIKGGGDGIYVGRGDINTYSSNIQIKDVVCDNNHRNGISVTSAQNLLIENCVLKNTHGTSPQAGIDFEPNFYDDLLTNCTLKKCELSNNEKGITIVLLPYTQSSQPVSINIDSCVVQNNPSSLSVRGPNTSVPYLGYLVLHDNQLIGPQDFTQTTGLNILYEYPSTNPTIGISQSSLAFGDVIVNTASSEKTYIVQGSNLSPASGNITITPPSGYQVSAASGSGFGSSLNVSYTGGKLSSKTIYVRFTPTAAQSYTGNITCAGGGATTKNVAVTGTGISTTSPMLTVNPTSLSLGIISINTTSQSSFTLSGSYLSPAAGNITITAPAGYTVSQTSSSGYASSITCAYTGNTLSSRTIYVRFTPTAAQSYIGTITIAGGSATTKNVAVTGTGIATTAPTLIVSNASLSFGNITINTTRLSSYEISGSNLSPAAGNITITAPAGYTISENYDSGYSSSITCAYTGITFSGRIIYVRFTPTAAQIYTGNITNAGGGATTKNVAVSGTGISGTTPTLTVSNTSLSFGNVFVNTASQSSFTISGSHLSPAAGNITITAPTGYTVSQTYGSGYASSITCAYTSNTLSARAIYVRFSPTATQSYSGNITVAGGSATTKNVAVSGTGIPTTIPILTVSSTSLSFGNVFVNTASQSSFTISGSDLSPAAGNITITAPTGYTVSQTYGSGYASSITCAYTSNTLSARAIYVRFTPTALQSYTGNITCAGGGATTKNIAATGTGIPTTTPTLTLNQTSLSFGNAIINTISSEQIYTLTGLNLSPASGSLTITAPSGFTISTVSGSDFTSSKTIAYTGGVLSAKVIYVRFSPTTAQTYAGDITNAGGGATTKNVAVTGTGIGIASPEININPNSLEFSTVRIGTNSTDRMYTLQGSSLSPASGSISITSPSGYQVSLTSGYGFTSSLNVSYTGSTISPKTIYVRFSPTIEQIYTGNITNSGGGAPAQSVAVSGTGVSATSAALTVNPTSLSFGDVIVNTTSNEMSYALTGLNLLPASDSLTITATAGYTISTTSGSGFTSSKRIAYAGGMLQPIPKIIYVRFSPTDVQSYFGVITNSGGTSAEQAIAISGNGINVPQPELTADPTSLSFGNIANNTISSEKTYVLSGSNLSPASGNITLTAPTGFQVSLTTGSGFDSTITIPYTGGKISEKTIYGRFLPTALQAYSGSITNTGGGATAAAVLVSGDGVEPTITVGPSSLPFSSVIINTTSSERTFSLTASGLTPASGTIIVTAPSPAFQVSLTSGSEFSSSVNVNYSDGTLLSPVTIYVRFLPTAEQNYSGNITNTGGGAAAQDVSVSGAGVSATAPLIITNPTSLSFANVQVNTISTRKSYTLSAVNLMPASGYNTVKAPTGFQVSTSSGSGFDSSLTIAYSGGTLAETTIYVRFCPTAVQNYSGNIANTGGGAVAESVYVSGSSLPPTLSMTPDSLLFGSVIINTSNVKTYMFSGSNLQPENDTLKITVPVGFTISTASDSGFNSSIYIPYTMGNLSSTMLFVKFSPVAVQSYSGNVTHTGGGTEVQNVMVSGECAIPSLTVSSSSVNFGDVPVNTTSIESTYKINGSNLTPASGNIIVTTPSGFEASITSGSGFSSSINIPYTANTLSPTTVYVQFIPMAVQSFIGNIANDGGGATTQNVAVSGIGINAPFLFVNPTSLSFGYVTMNARSREVSYTLSSANLIAGGTIEITSPRGFEVSTTSGAGFDTSISISGTVDTLLSRLIYVRFSPTAAENYDGYITNAANGAPTINVAVSGIGLPLKEVVQLGQNFPNPFNPITKIPYAVFKKSWVRLTIYNILGQQIRTLINEEQDVGYYQPEFNISRSNNGAELSSGIYFYRLEIAGISVTKKLIVLK